MVAAVMGMVKLMYRDKTWTEVSGLTPTAVPKQQNETYPLWEMLPYSGDGFTVDRYIAPWTLAIKITAGTREEAEVKISKWLEAQGELGKNHTLVVSD